MFYCYKVTNLSNGKVYVGKTNNIKIRWSAHQSRALNPNDSHYNYPISCAIRKYGSNNFQFEILTSCITEEEVNSHESYYITLYRSNINTHGKRFGYNLTDGGEGTVGWKPTNETRNKMSKSHNGLKHSQETLAKMCAARGGENTPTSKLTWEIVAKIREEYQAGQIAQKKLGAKYSVSQSIISDIVNNRSWKNVSTI